MKKEKKFLINFIVSFISHFITIVLGLIVPRIVLTCYGSDTNGLTSTISQVFTYMALMEAGISASARNALYKPIKENDKEGISYWISASRYYYRKISIIYFLLIVCMSFLMPIILKTNIDYWTIVFYVFFEGLISVVSFYFISSWNCFLTANGNMYFINIVNLFVKILMYSVKIVLALMKFKIAFIQLGFFVVSLIQLLIYYLYMSKKYSWINYKSAPKNAKLPDRRFYVVTEIAWTVFSSTDMIILSIFVSTQLSSVYSVYNMVFVAINGLLNAVYSALNYYLGHTYMASMEQYKKMHNLFNSFFIGGMTALMCVTYVLIIPFVGLYTRSVTDINYINYSLPVLFCLIQLLSWSRYVAGNLSGIAGYAKETSRVSLLEAFVNLVLSIVLVNYLGIIGVLLATVISLPAKMVFLNWQAEKRIMQRSPIKTIQIIGTNFFIFVVTVLISHFIDINVESYFDFFVYGIAFLVLFSSISFVINGIINKDVFKIFKKLLIRSPQ